MCELVGSNSYCIYPATRYDVSCLYVTVHAERWHKSAKFVSRYRPRRCRSEKCPPVNNVPPDIIHR